MIVLASTNVEIHVLQGERELVSGNKSLGNFRLDGIPKADRGVPQIEVTFDIDVDGLLSVKAKEVETGVEQSVTIQGASNLEETEIETMLSDAEKYASADQEKRQNIDLKNQAETLCFEVEKELESLSDKIPDSQQTKIKDLIQDIRNDIQSEKFDSLNSTIDLLKLEMKNIIDENNVVSNDESMDDLNDL